MIVCIDDYQLLQVVVDYYKDNDILVLNRYNPNDSLSFPVMHSEIDRDFFLVDCYKYDGTLILFGDYI